MPLTSNELCYSYLISRRLNSDERRTFKSVIVKVLSTCRLVTFQIPSRRAASAAADVDIDLSFPVEQPGWTATTTTRALKRQMESPFQSYLNTNYSASDIEKLQITQFVIGLQDELKALETELVELISRLESGKEQLKAIDAGLAEVRQRIEALTDKQERQIHFIEQHTALLNPIHSIPIDILQSIFEHCVNDPAPFASTEPVTDAMSPVFCPLLLTFVCSSWRRIALKCPSLWDKPYIFLPAPISGISPVRWIEILKKRAQLIHLWLCRAGTRPLTIALASPPGHESNDGFRAVEQAVIAFSSQWERLRVRGSNCVLQSLLAVPGSLVPNLKFVDLAYGSFPGAIEADTAVGRPDCLISAPSLRVVRLAGTSLRKFQLIPLPWSRLTDIRFGRLVESQGNSFNDSEALELLSRCPKIQRCELYLPIGHVLQEPRGHHNQVILPHLTYLDFTHSQSTALLFRSLDLPVLTTLKFSTHFGAESLSILLTRCAGTLRHFELSAHQISAEELLPMLSQAVHLEWLELAYRAYGGSPSPLLTDELLKGLTPPIPEESTKASGSFHCPNLQNLILHVSNEPDGPRISDKAIYNFIRGRRALETPTVRHVAIYHPAHDKQEDVGAMLREQGVDIGDLKFMLRYRNPGRYGYSTSGALRRR